MYLPVQVLTVVLEDQDWEMLLYTDVWRGGGTIRYINPDAVYIYNFGIDNFKSYFVARLEENGFGKII